QPAAVAAITAAGLMVGTTFQRSVTVPAGIVIAQFPGALSALAPGSTVRLIVSSGPLPVPLPNVVGQTQPAAVAALPAAALMVGTVTSQPSVTVPAGIVIAQVPAGAAVAPGSPVNLVVSSAPLLGATFTVTNTNDTGAGTLRQAIIDANASPGLDTIAFN